MPKLNGKDEHEKGGGFPMSTSPRWESVHVCPRCTRATDLANLDFQTITTGIFQCTHCDWSGPIEIQVVDAATIQKQPR